MPFPLRPLETMDMGRLFQSSYRPQTTNLPTGTVSSPSPEMPKLTIRTNRPITNKEHSDSTVVIYGGDEPVHRRPSLREQVQRVFPQTRHFSIDAIPALGSWKFGQFWKAYCWQARPSLSFTSCAYWGKRENSGKFPKPKGRNKEKSGLQMKLMRQDFVI